MQDTTNAAGGYRVTLAPNTASTVGGHSYQFLASDALFGTGTSGGVSQALNGSIDVMVDGQAAQIRFDLMGCGQQGMPPTHLSARLQRTRATVSETVLRSYDVTSTGAGAMYQFANPAPPAGCTVGVDLMAIKFP